MAIGVEIVSTNKTLLNDNDVLELTVKVTAAADFVASAVAADNSSTVLTRGTLAADQPQVISLAARGMSEGRNEVVITALGDNAFVARASVIVDVKRTAISIETEAGGKGVPVGALRMRMGETRTLFAIARDSQGRFVADANAGVWSSRSGTAGTFAPNNAAATTFTAAFTNAVITDVIVFTDPTFGSGTTGQLTVVPLAISIENAADGNGTTVSATTLRTGRALPLFAILRDAGDNTYLGNVSANWSVSNGAGSFSTAVNASAVVFTAGGSGGISGEIRARPTASAAPYVPGALPIAVDWATHTWQSADIRMNESWAPGQPKATITSDHGAVIAADFFETPGQTTLDAYSPGGLYDTFVPNQVPTGYGPITADLPAEDCESDPLTETETLPYSVHKWWSNSGTPTQWAIGFVGISTIARGNEDGGENSAPTTVPGATNYDLVMRNQRKTNSNGSGAVAAFTVPLTATYTMQTWARRMRPGLDADSATQAEAFSGHTAELRVYADPVADITTPLTAIIVGTSPGDAHFQWTPQPPGTAPVRTFPLTAAQGANRIYLRLTRGDKCSAAYDATQVVFELKATLP